MRKFTKSSVAVAMLAAAAIVAPSASAMPIDTPLPDRTAPGRDVGPNPVVYETRTVEAASGGFDWGDAGIGAAGMVSLLGLGAGGVVIARRGRRGQPAVG